MQRGKICTFALHPPQALPGIHCTTIHWHITLSIGLHICKRLFYWKLSKQQQCMCMYATVWDASTLKSLFGYRLFFRFKNKTGSAALVSFSQFVARFDWIDCRYGLLLLLYHFSLFPAEPCEAQTFAVWILMHNVFFVSFSDLRLIFFSQVVEFW